jgi:spore coat-associated protein N
MSRLSTLWTLVAGVAAVLALCVAAGSLSASGANFTASSRNSDSYRAGNFTLINSAGGIYVIDAVSLRPGQSVSGTLTLTNQGDFSAGCTCRVEPGTMVNLPQPTHLSAALNLSIDDITTTTQNVWSGILDTFTSVTLAPFAVGASRIYRFTVTFPTANASPLLQNSSVVVPFIFDGIAQ